MIADLYHGAYLALVVYLGTTAGAALGMAKYAWETRNEHP